MKFREQYNVKSKVRIYYKIIIQLLSNLYYTFTEKKHHNNKLIKNAFLVHFIKKKIKF